ncbi:hypothetical protein HN587_06545 [Candidatus Woesearchaeota archaeon]|jgi:hypothetical protein|nr:hypothetical protein [Candidatus Woesearchaeota archaeon]
MIKTKKAMSGALLGLLAALILMGLALLIYFSIGNKTGNVAGEIGNIANSMTLKRCACLFDPPICPSGSQKTLNYPGCLPDKLSAKSNKTFTVMEGGFFGVGGSKSEPYNLDCSKIESASDYIKTSAAYKKHYEQVKKDDGLKSNGLSYGSLCLGSFKDHYAERDNFDYES